MRLLLLVILCLSANAVLSAEQEVPTDVVFPQKLTAAELRVYCAASAISATGRQRQRYCDGFLSGMEEGIRVLGLISGNKGVATLCVPASVSAREMRAAFVKHSAALNPPTDKPAVRYAIEVLEKAYPCQ